MDSKEKEVLQAIIMEIQKLWFEVEEIKEFKFEEDKDRFMMERYKRLDAIEAMLKNEE